MAIPPSEIPKITFIPPLPKDKVEGLKDITKGKLCQFVMTYNEPFWTKLGYTGDVHVVNDANDTKKPIICCFDISTKDNPTIMGYVLMKADLKKNILQQLAFYFGNEALDPLHFTIEEWKNGSPVCCYKSFEKMSLVQERSERYCYKYFFLI